MKVESVEELLSNAYCKLRERITTKVQLSCQTELGKRVDLPVEEKKTALNISYASRRPVTSLKDSTKVQE